MRLRIGYSPCPNDTFLFDALVHHKIDTGDLDFEVTLADVEQLNRLAFEGELDVTKLSYHAYAYLSDRYALLDAGSALGNNCGPLLIARTSLDESDILEGPVAIPGKFTTANFLFSLAYPGARNKVEMLFSDIEQAVLDGRVKAGVIIHENRFTYAQRGLVKIVDLGEYWESVYGMPIPLGGIAIRRGLPVTVQEQFGRFLRQSVEQAFRDPEGAMPYVRCHAQEMDDAVMMQHIRLYVNDFSVSLGERGRAAIRLMYAAGREKGILPPIEEKIFTHYE